ncbi:uncharacterized protein LOC131842904 [Achroia grisella]|uniref:uncharacterized protein LOC131842904 n=1 Tax=Achroia grisella TaxID=688607 RepID=UPI0027D2E81B|nr:uncharacterized protein LOC131842904 [Achroia grisella]
MDNMDPENDLANFINSRSYMQNDRELPKVSIIKNVDNDVTYLLSKLSDEELIKLLNTQPTKSEYDLDDIVNITFDSKSGLDNILKNSKAQSHRNTFNENVDENSNKFNFKPTTKTDKDPMAFFRLENKEVDPYVKSDDSNYRAVQKLSDLLNNYQMNANSEDLGLDDDKKELLFDILVSQLKTLCCKKSKPLARNIMYKYMPEATQKMSHEYIFLIVNDEIKNNGSDELMSVDPNSLDKNSSVLLLGPITTPLTDSQLKTVDNPFL